MIIQSNWNDSPGCKSIRDKFYLANEYSIDTYDLYQDTYGEIWQYMVLRYPGGYSGSGILTNYYIYPILPLTGSRTINTRIESTIYDSIVVEGYPYAKLKVEMYHSDGTYEIYNSGNYIYGLSEVDFYICGCNENDIRCGKDCCINCCDLAKEILDNYSNILE